MEIAALVSGGVDSSVVVHQLKEAGYDPTIFYIRIGMEDKDGYIDCPAEEDIEITSYIARKYGCRMEVVSLHDEYWDKVVSYTIDSVKRGLTPNPDMMCNKFIKFGCFEEKWGKDFDKIATGHYATTTDFGDEVETMQVDCLPVLRFRVVAVGDVDDVALDILLDDEPRTAAQAQSFPLADGMEPIAVVLAQYLARFQFDDFSDTFAQVTLDEVVVIDFTEEADALAVLAHGAGELLFGSDGTDFRFHQVAGRLRRIGDLYRIESENKIQGIAPGQYGVVYDKDHHLCLGSGMIIDEEK